MLEEFWAVTRTSVYHIQAKGNARTSPSAIKVAQHSPSQTPIGTKLQGAQMISVGKQIICYVLDKHAQRDINSISMSHWGGQTSLVVALFTDKTRAMRCSKESNLQPCDPRWQKESKAVLDAIGKDHPIFFVPHDDLALFPPVRAS